MDSDSPDSDGPRRPAGTVPSADRVEVRRLGRSGGSVVVVIPAHLLPALGEGVGGLVRFFLDAGGGLRLRSHRFQEAAEPSGIIQGVAVRALLRRIARLERKRAAAWRAGYHAGTFDALTRRVADAERLPVALPRLEGEQ